jgi:hypothetical protein
LGKLPFCRVDFRVGVLARYHSITFLQYEELYDKRC